MTTLMEDLQQCEGQKLIDADEMKNDKIVFDYLEEYSFLLYIGKIEQGFNTLR